MSVQTLMTQSYSLVVWQLVTCCLCAAHYVTLGIAGRPFSHRRGAWDIILKIDKLMVNNNVFYSNYIIMAYYYYKNRMALLCYSFSRIYYQLIHYDWGGITNCSAVLNIKWVLYSCVVYTCGCWIDVSINDSMLGPDCKAHWVSPQPPPTQRLAKRCINADHLPFNTSIPLPFAGLHR